MWSDQTTRATRVTELSRISSFWEVAPVSAVDEKLTTPFVAAPAPMPPMPARAAAAEEGRPSFAELERDAFTKGYAQGERAGAEAAARRGEATLRRLAQTIEDLGGLRTELVQKTERQVVELAVAIARRILHREISLDRELLVTMARVALERLGEKTSATIRLNPDDYASIGARTQVAESTTVRIVADPAVNTGGCLVQSDFGLIDLGLEAQLREMAVALGVAPGSAGTQAGAQERGAA